MNIFRKSCKLFFLGLCLTLAACGRESESENENGNEEANGREINRKEKLVKQIEI